LAEHSLDLVRSVYTDQAERKTSGLLDVLQWNEAREPLDTDFGGDHVIHDLAAMINVRATTLSTQSKPPITLDNES
jgi:hypothetical protein